MYINATLNRTKKIIRIVPAVIFLMVVTIFSSSAQTTLNGLLNKATSGLKIQIGKKNRSEIKNEKSDYQNVFISAADTAKYYKVSDDLMLDIGDTKKNYPKGYKPKWGMIGDFATFQFTKVNYLQGKMSTSDARSIGIDQFNGRAYVYIGGFLGCNCAARLLKDNEHVVINNKTQTFFTDDFYQIKADGSVTSTPCKNMTMSYYDTGGWKMKISLSMDNNQLLLANAIVESLTVQSSYISRNGTNIASVWSSDDTSFPNLLPAEKAVATQLQKEKDEKDAIAGRIAREKKEKEERIAFEASIKNSYAKVAALQSKFAEVNLECIKRNEYTEYVPGYTHEYTDTRVSHYDPVTKEPVEISVPVKETTPGRYEKHVETKNTCNKTIVILGITKNISPSNTVYYTDASIKLAAGDAVERTFTIEEYYQPKKAEIGSTHYYRKKIVLK